MFTTQHSKHLAGLLAFGAALVVGQSAYAIGIASGVSVQNDVTVDYEVGGTAQTQLTDSVSFLVDNKIDLSIAVVDDTVVPNQADQVLTYTIVNEGNTTQGYRLAVANSTVADDFNMNNVTIYVEDGTTPGFQIAEDTLYVAASNAGDLDPNSLVPGADTMIVYVVADVPPNGGGTAPANGTFARYDLLATTTNAGTATITTDNSAAAWNPATVQVVFAEGAAGPHASDAANDGELSATGEYEVTTAALVVTKSQAVLSDGFSPVGFEKAIPGAVVEYTITLDNTSGAIDATTLVVNDDFDDASITYNVNSVDVDITSVGTDTNITDGNSGANTGATVAISDQGGVAAKDDRVQVSTFTVPAGETATITFSATID